MTIERYPANLAIGVQDFVSSGWKDALASTFQEGYSSMWQAFSAAARQAIDENRPSQGKVLWLLADACSMMLTPKSINEPFKPFMVMDGRRSAIPDDLLETDVTFFSQIIDQIDEHWLKARLADLVWLLQRKLGAKFALDAIDAYMNIPLDTEAWVVGGQECWERAISLILMLKTGAGNRLGNIEASIIAAFDSSTKADGFLALWLSDLLMQNQLARTRSEVIAAKLELLAHQFDMDGDLHRARSFFSAASNWFQKGGDTSKAAEATVRMAEGWIKEATARISSNEPSCMVAASFYEKAIQIYRTIPRSERAIHKADERMAELHQKMSAAGEKSLDEMGIITTPGVDITMLVENARQAVMGKTMLDALSSFANIYKGACVAQIRTSAEKNLQQSIARHLFASTHLSRDGRVIAKQPAAGFNGLGGDNLALWAQMAHDYQILINIVVQGDIWPAQEILLQEHRLRESDFISMAQQSPIVPSGREQLFGKALFAGYEKDFVTSLHILVPQIEHMVRTHLKNAGVKTTNLDKDGIENENGLSTLMDLPEATQVFGEDIAFELKILFCNAFGPNLRNELAHGLLDDTTFYSPAAIYAWWFGMRLVFKTFWNAARKTNTNGMTQEENANGPTQTE